MLIVDGQTLKIYTLDGVEAVLPVAGIAGAQAIVQPASGSAQALALAPMDDPLHGTVPAGVTSYTAIMTVPLPARRARPASRSASTATPTTPTDFHSPVFSTPPR